MKAIQVHQFGGPEVLSLEEIPTPKPGPGEVLVHVRAAGVNPYRRFPTHQGPTLRALLKPSAPASPR